MTGNNKADNINESDLDDFNDSDSDDQIQRHVFKQKKQTSAFKGEQDDGDISLENGDSDDENLLEYKRKSPKDVPIQDEIDIEIEEGETENFDESDLTNFNLKIKNIKKLTPEKLEKEQKRIKRTGVCYLSRIPPYMKPSKLRSVLTRFGSIDRLFLKPEDNAIYHKRVKYGGNKKKNFTEGWVEFLSKKDAKLCASTLNANKLGGKKTSYYYDDIINIKYLSGFKWADLTQQIAKENEVRQAKLNLELSQQKKLNKSYVENVEKSKMIKNIQKRRLEQSQDNVRQEEIRRSFKQRKVRSTRADAKEELKEKSKPNDKLSGVLSKVF